VRDASGARTDISFKALVEKTMGGAPLARADLHIGQSRDGELFVTSRQDGMIRMLVPDSGSTGTTR
jgi:redox-regulated HSP33 family molecular chaperone